MPAAAKHDPPTRPTSAQILAVTLPALSHQQLLQVRTLMRQAMEHLCPLGVVEAIKERRMWAMANALDDVDQRLAAGGATR